MRSTILVLAGALALVGCVTPAEVDDGIDEGVLLSTLTALRTSPPFAPVNGAPYPTALGTGAYINVFVSTYALPWYAPIAPERTGVVPRLPLGTLLVREVLDDDGQVDKLTLMFKGPAGYNPELGDWWFGVTDPEGNVLDDDGVRQAGRLSECYGCHLPRAADDFVFGVPLGNRPAAGR